MFDSISFTELITILLIALVVFGPQRLPELARKAGTWAREIRKTAAEFRRGLDQEVSDLKKPFEEVKADLDKAREDLKAAGNEVKKSVEWVGPPPVIGPSPAEALPDKPTDQPGAPEEIE
ncbi:MAG: Sec-independent protein translocase protein TatB [Acidimicrobiia bacterium]|nr:Sec-independent protein translocase protein TatB [Acidimicrobiia bacterium]MDH3396798.1 Sec-independent protein translocase protein TatB [Acidimicrobiia bacterium]